MADDLARFENRSRRFARADFFRDAMQSERRAVRAFRLPDAETRSGAGEFFYEFVLLKKRNGLPGDADGENELSRSNFVFFATVKKIKACIQSANAIGFELIVQMNKQSSVIFIHPYLVSITIIFTNIVTISNFFWSPPRNWFVPSMQGRTFYNF